jgi:predicted N-acetyltransferase YhbS
MQSITVIDHTNITTDRAREIVRLNELAWPSKEEKPDEEKTQAVIDEFKEPVGPLTQRRRVFCIMDHKKILAKASIFPRLIGTPDGDMVIMALASVCSDPKRRGEGLGAMVVRAAFQQVDLGHFPLALFQTTTPVKPFYEKLGARKVTNTFINSKAEDAGANPWWDPEIMIYPADANWPAGTIDLKGKGY